MKKFLEIVGDYIRFGRNSVIDGQTRLLRFGRDEFEYHENERSLVFQIELLRGVPNRIIYKSTINKWLPPFDHVQLSSDDSDRIASKVKVFWEGQGISAAIRD